MVSGAGCRNTRMIPGYKSATDLKEKYPLVDDTHDQYWSPEKKERFETDCFPRVAQCMKHLLAGRNSNLLIVSHSAPIAGVFKHVVGRAYHVGLCTISRLDRHDDKWKVVMAGDSTHLSDRTGLRAY